VHFFWLCSTCRNFVFPQGNFDVSRGNHYDPCQKNVKKYNLTQSQFSKLKATDLFVMVAPRNVEKSARCTVHTLMQIAVIVWKMLKALIFECNFPNFSLTGIYPPSQGYLFLPVILEQISYDCEKVMLRTFCILIGWEVLASYMNGWGDFLHAVTVLCAVIFHTHTKSALNHNCKLQQKGLVQEKFIWPCSRYKFSLSNDWK
jgi:hypothetical protein